MQYGICTLSIVPVRENPDPLAPMTSQLLFGEYFKILETRKHWSKIRNAFDKHTGWVTNAQLTVIPQEVFEQIATKKAHSYSTDLISYVSNDHNRLRPVLLGSCLDGTSFLSLVHEGSVRQGQNPRSTLVKTALLYLHSPEISGGKSPFGIDASGFAQMVYRINGHKLLRQTEEQATQGRALSFVEESEAGDLAFFDNGQGIIDHVGIILENNYIIHVNGQVRIDRLDHTGIFNTELGKYTHALRVIKTVIK